MRPSKRNPDVDEISQESSTAASTVATPVHSQVDINQYADCRTGRSRCLAKWGHVLTVVDGHLDIGLVAGQHVARRALLRPTTRWAIKMSSIQPAAMTSASETLATVTPIALDRR